MVSLWDGKGCRMVWKEWQLDGRGLPRGGRGLRQGERWIGEWLLRHATHVMGCEKTQPTRLELALAERNHHHPATDSPPAAHAPAPSCPV